MRPLYFSLLVPAHLMEKCSCVFGKNALVLLNSLFTKSKNSEAAKGGSISRFAYRRSLQCVALLFHARKPIEKVSTMLHRNKKIRVINLCLFLRVDKKTKLNFKPR